MEGLRIPGEGVWFAEIIRERLRQTKDGAITISKQNGKVMHLTLTESQENLKGYRKRAADKATAGGGLSVANEELEDIVALVDSVRYGTVVLRLKGSRIVGVEKNESVKP
ncbi:MAG: YezD family protein [Clostridiales Family XIII bacterium]|jgi:hypothetical protein|nr:YezD family protein [Clostridiales Family XIII bacterium]